MIDWLDVQIPLNHVPVEQGCYMVVNHDGDIERKTAIRRRVTGSHDSTIGISSQTMSPDDVVLGKASHLCLSGNPCKFLQGHNVCGIECIRSLLVATLNEVMPLLSFSDFEIARAVDAVVNFNFTVSRIDITRSFIVGNGTNADLEAYLYMLPQQVRGRGGRVTAVNGTVYLGQRSTLWTIKIYNKYLELLKGHKGHGLSPKLKDSGLLEFAEGQARIELVLRKKALVRHKATNPKVLQSSLDNLFAEYLGRIDMHSQEINSTQINHIPRSLQSTYFLWKQGENLQNILPRTTFHRHRKALKDFDIDIALPPIAPENKTCVPVKLHKILSPRAVTTIPSQLQKYVVRQLNYA